MARQGDGDRAHDNAAQRAHRAARSHAMMRMQTTCTQNSTPAHTSFALPSHDGLSVAAGSDSGTATGTSCKRGGRSGSGRITTHAAPTQCVQDGRGRQRQSCSKRFGRSKAPAPARAQHAARRGRAAAAKSNNARQRAPTCSCSPAGRRRRARHTRRAAPRTAGVRQGRLLFANEEDGTDRRACGPAVARACAVLRHDRGSGERSRHAP